jgi:hypothetical protein
MITGECFCGAIRYRINGRLQNARSCHCSRCRKAFSGQASAYALVEPDEFKWVSGQNKLISSQVDDPRYIFCRTAKRRG